jgi:hypothetical protein
MFLAKHGKTVVTSKNTVVNCDFGVVTCCNDCHGMPRLPFGASSWIRYWLLQKKHIHRKTFRASSLDFCTHRSMALTTSFKEYAQHHETKSVTFPQALQKMITMFAKCSKSH